MNAEGEAQRDGTASADGADDQLSGPRGRAAAPEDAPASEATSASWLLLFRAIVITVLLGATIVFRTMRGEPATDVQSVAIYTVCAITYASILAAALWIRTHGETNATVAVYVPLAGDCVVASVLVLSTGGHESAFTFLYILSIINAAAALGQRAALAVAAVATAMYALTLAIQASYLATWLGVVHITWRAAFAPMLVNTLAFFLVAYLASSLTAKLTSARLRLSRAEEALVRAEASHEDVLQSIPSGVVTLGAEGGVRFLNAAGAEILGFDRPDDVRTGSARISALLSLDKPIGARFEATVDTPAGARVVGAKIAPLKRADRTEGRVIVFQDLTEVQQLRRQLGQADRLRSVGRFAAGVAHEIRNPLASMMGCLQLLEDDARADTLKSDDAQRLIGIVLRETERLSHLITDFLTYARPAPPDTVDTDVNAVVRTLVETRNTDESAALEVAYTAASTLAIAHIDAHHVQQVLWNLVANAERAALAAKGAPPKVRVEVRTTAHTVLIHVDDSGPGVPLADRARIFEPFFTTSEGGTGLGLSTAYQLLDAMGGSIDVVESDLGGARFIVALPVRAGHSVIPQPSERSAY